MELTILLGTFFILLFLGCPIAMTMLISSLLTLIAKGLPLTMIPQNLAGGADSFTLLAVPFYIFAGELMNMTGITQRIFDFAMALVGHIKGGLGHVNVLASMIFAGISGSSSADAAGLGRIEIEAMRKEGYDLSFSAAITAASSTIGPIIPPSIHLVIYGAIAEVSVADLFIAGIVPGIILGAAFMLIIYIMASTGYVSCPVRKRQSGIEIFRTFRRAFFPLFAPIIILGGILIGVVTPTEAGVIAVFYAGTLGFFYRELTKKSLITAMKNTVHSTAVVMFILSTAKSFAWLITLERIPESLADGILRVTTNPNIVLILICVGLFLIGTIGTASANLIIVTPILVSIALKINIDLVHLGLVVVFALMIGLITPPVGTSLYIVADVAGISFDKMSKAAIIFVIPMVIVLLLITLVPELVLFLPKFFGYSG